MSITETRISRDSSDDSPLIKLGEISYINCKIFNYPLNKIIQSRRRVPENGRVAERTSSNAEIGVRLHAKDAFKIEISSGVPSHLNKLFAEGLIDAAPISSFAYLKIKEHCNLIETIFTSFFFLMKKINNKANL